MSAPRTSARARVRRQKGSQKPSRQSAASRANLGRQTPARPAEGLIAAQLLTAAQLAERLQVPKSQVYRLSRSGQLPVVRTGRYFRYRLDDIEEWERNGGTG